jgi:hypothetical protein
MFPMKEHRPFAATRENWFTTICWKFKDKLRNNNCHGIRLKVGRGY